MINFISHLPKHLRTGGFSAMNAAACAALEQRHQVAYVGPIDPPAVPWQKAVSKALRLSGRGGDFFAYSERRLRTIAREVERRAKAGARLDFFHGFTAWIATRPARPYAAWSDCTFADYIEIFHDRRVFRADDLARIEQAEAQWLRGARRVLFTSEWAAQRATRACGLDPGRVGSVGIFGELEPPPTDVYAGEASFAFVSTDFAAKGGPVVLEAFRRVREARPDVQLTIVGAPPPSSPPSLASATPASCARKTRRSWRSCAPCWPVRGPSCIRPAATSPRCCSSRRRCSAARRSPRAPSPFRNWWRTARAAACWMRLAIRPKSPRR